MLLRSGRNKNNMPVEIENNSNSFNNSQSDNLTSSNTLGSHDNENNNQASSPENHIVGIYSQAANDSVGGQANSFDSAVEEVINSINDDLQFSDTSDVEDLNLNLNLNCISGIPSNTPLIRVPFSKMGCLIGISNSISFIPDNLVFSVRQLFIKYLREIDNVVGSSNAIALSWKRYFLLPTILFSYNESDGGKIKEEMKKKIDLLSINKWESFTIESLSLRVVATGNTISTEQSYHHAEKLIKAGQLSKAYKSIVGDKSRITPSLEVYDALTIKYPPEGINKLTDSQLNELNGFRFNDSIQKPHISVESLGKIVMKGDNMIAHGFDHFRYEHLKQLWGYKDHDSYQNEFRLLYTKLINKIMCADIPTEIRSLIADSEAFAIPKGVDDIRPLGKINLDRKIAAKCVLHLNNPAIRDNFKDIQLGCAQHGTERIVHSVRVCMETNPDFDCFFPDAEKAFNYSSRKHGLYETLKRIPSMYPFLSMIYGANSKSWFFGCQDGISSIDCQEGSQQGCTLGNFLCAMAFLPLLLGIINIMSTVGGYCKFFVDDGNLCAPFSQMLETITYIQKEGPYYGYVMHLGKGSYLLGRCGSILLALERRHKLIELGIDPNIIKIHPDDYLDANITQLIELGYDAELLSNHEIMLDVKKIYGAKVLGSYIGSNEYIKSNLISKAEKLDSEASMLIEYPDLQQRFQLFRWCFNEKINYLLRTIPPKLTEELTSNFNLTKKRIMCSILNQFNLETLPEWLWVQCCLPINEGGLGLNDSVLVAYTAYASSFIDCLPTSEEICPNLLDSNICCLVNLNNSIAYINDVSKNNQNHVTDFDIVSLRTLGLSGNNKFGLQHYLYSSIVESIRRSFIDSLDSKHLGWFLSVSNDIASRWLSVLPKSPSFTFDSSSFRILLCNRLYLPQPERCEGLRCDCIKGGEHPIIDERCHHLVTGCAKSGFGINLHHGVTNTIKEMVNAAGFRAKREENGCFQNILEEFNDHQRKMRPDLSIFDLPGPSRKVILDISNICPIPIYGSQPYTRNDAKIIQKAAQIRYDERMEKFDRISTANGIKFHPIIFETTGRIHSDSLIFLQTILRNISGFMDGKLLKLYWLSRISCSYQQQIAIAIRDKLRKQKGHRFISGNFENNPEFAIASCSVFLART